ncbi:MAG: NAD-dependent deacylase [Deltaproteobacteria bacterium]|jgi:NAD-dependent deacetylase|nr:NAD-dependent deacylase [Deltaproteobacteria bacterium]
MIFFLTGAGISKESGLDTFRDKDGLWAKVDLAELATIEALKRNPDKTLAFYDQRRRTLLSGEIRPNAAHLALAELEKKGVPMFLATQNVDDLHEEAGSENVVHMHGRLLGALCDNCGHRMDWRADLGTKDVCPDCRKTGTLRPDVVLFGEVPYHLEAIDEALSRSSLFVSIGTSGTVYPAAGYLRQALGLGLKTVELNLEASRPGLFNESFYGPATEVVPAFAAEILSGRRQV